jgi:intron-binding protein aquarius
MIVRLFYVPSRFVLLIFTNLVPDVILSLVRTRTVGYLRDVRRLTVALSRARLGLYILGRLDVFASCYELKPAFDILTKRANKLMLVPGEMYPATRLQEDNVEGTAMEGLEHLGQYVFEMTQAKIKALGAEGIAATADIPEEYDEEADEDEIMVGTDDNKDLTVQQHV